MRAFSVRSVSAETVGQFDTFDAAERSAKARFQGGESGVEICSESGATLADVRSDALGRVWTDLTWRGALMARAKR